MSSLVDTENTNWLALLPRWALLTGLAYLGLVLAFVVLVVPAGQNSPLPEDYSELIAATREPVLYRLTIAFDIASWLALGGLFITFAGLFDRRAPIRGAFVKALGVGMVSGFIGACFRLRGTSDLASHYLAVTPDQQAILLQSYVDLLRLINILFSAGGLLAGVALMLAASVTWSMAEFPRWMTRMIILSGLVEILKGILDLATGMDLGPLGLLGSIFLIVALLGIARTFWRGVPADQAPWMEATGNAPIGDYEKGR